MLENNPYEGKLTQKQIEGLIKYIKLGRTADAENLGLASKFELEALNEYLLVSYGLVMVKVSNGPSGSVIFPS